MIYIIDNGESYSDHALHFVEADLDADDMARVVAMKNSGQGWRRSFEIIGVAPSIAWRDAAGSQLLGQFLHPADLVENSHDLLSGETRAALTTTIAAALVRDWRTMRIAGGWIPAANWVADTYGLARVTGKPEGP